MRPRAGVGRDRGRCRVTGQAHSARRRARSRAPPSRRSAARARVEATGPGRSSARPRARPRPRSSRRPGSRATTSALARAQRRGQPPPNSAPATAAPSHRAAPTSPSDGRDRAPSAAHRPAGSASRAARGCGGRRRSPDGHARVGVDDLRLERRQPMVDEERALADLPERLAPPQRRQQLDLGLGQPEQSRVRSSSSVGCA